MRETNPTDALQRFVDRYPRQLDAARALGISPAYLSDLLHERRDMTEPMLAKLGLKQIVVKSEKAS